MHWRTSATSRNASDSICINAANHTYIKCFCRETFSTIETTIRLPVSFCTLTSSIYIWHIFGYFQCGKLFFLAASIIVWKPLRSILARWTTVLFVLLYAIHIVFNFLRSVLPLMQIERAAVDCKHCSLQSSNLFLLLHFISLSETLPRCLISFSSLLWSF